MSPSFEIYTNGSFDASRGIGTYGFISNRHYSKKGTLPAYCEKSPFMPKIYAIFMAVRNLSPHLMSCDICVYTDVKYSLLTFCEKNPDHKICKGFLDSAQKVELNRGSLKICDIDKKNPKVRVAHQLAYEALQEARKSPPPTAKISETLGAS